MEESKGRSASEDERRNTGEAGAARVRGEEKRREEQEEGV